MLKGMKYKMSINPFMTLSEIGSGDYPLLKLSKEASNNVSDIKELDKPFKSGENKEKTNTDASEKKSLTNAEKEVPETQETKLPIQNKIDGLKREEEVHNDLDKKYPEDKGYKVASETYLRDENGNIVKDPVTGEKRRIDFVVTKDGKVVDSVEVTSKTADKTEQSAKEERIRANGGNYIKDSDGNLIRMSDDVHTRIERRN